MMALIEPITKYISVIDLRTFLKDGLYAHSYAHTIGQIQNRISSCQKIYRYTESLRNLVLQSLG